MKAEYQDVWFKHGIEVGGSHKIVELPFRRITSRAIIVRKSDLALLGTLHRKGGKFALPGGNIEDGETAEEAIIRELDEERIQLIRPDPNWQETLAVDYYDGYKELCVWYIIPVKDVKLGESEENIESRWISQGEDAWYPYMRERIILNLCKLKPALAELSISIS
ncbi:MAG: NUDIX hydrolase [Anaerolineales bacterium]|jgi:hypothetical protein